MEKLSEKIKQQALKIGFDKVGIVDINLNKKKQEENRKRLEKWLNQGYNAQMQWMDNPKRKDITLCWEEVKSLICVGLNYYTPHQHSNEPNIGKISRYGWGRDYHRIMKKKLKILAQWLVEENPETKVKYYVDTGPIQDKFWAQEAGIGWVAKNANLITREYGSWVFLGEILTNLSVESDQAHTNHCGTCTRCLTACPTKAIVEPYVIDANRCIAYHTIENRNPQLPDEIVKNMNGWVAGCDICQDVCPWNQRFAQPTNVKEFEPYPENIAPTLAELAELSEDEWNRRFPASALRRIKPKMWRRNARANLGNCAG